MPRIGLALLLVINSSVLALAQDVGTLIAESDPVIQEQINKTYDAQSEVGALQEVHALKEITDDKGELVKQLAIFAVTSASEEEFSVLVALKFLHLLELPPSIPIRILAPYLDAENEQLRDFSQIWFHSHDSHERTHGRPPFGSLNYQDYMKYVTKRLERNGEIPDGFIKYIFEKHPGKALLVFSYANRQVVGAAQLRTIYKAREAVRQGREGELDELREGRRQQEVREEQAKEGQRKIEFAEHIVSNAIWLNTNEFAERFQAALPEAMGELEQLAKREQWWARLYVAEIMRQHPGFQQQAIVERLAEDNNALVSKAAKAIN